MKIDWKSKLASRKFWALLGGLASSLLLALSFSENEIAQVTGIITSFGAIAVYILAEASVDRANAQNRNETKDEE